MANGTQPGMAGSQGGQANYAQLMQALMTNPQAFTGGGFGQTLAANPQGGMSPQAAALAGNWYPGMVPQQGAPATPFAWGQQYGGGGGQQWPAAYAGSPIGQAIMGMSPQAAALASWQPQAPVMPAAANPIPALVAQQQAAAAPAAAAQAPPPVDNSVSGSGTE